MKGIDVSKYQGKIDWKTVKSQGIDFAIIRAGYGQNATDIKFAENIKGCIENGIKVGIYWFIYGVNEKEAVKNADKCHSVISQYANKITMKVWCDFEYDTDSNARKRGVVFTKALRTKMVKAFCERMKQYGYEIGVYANPDYLKTKFDDLSEYPLWLAWYQGTEEKAKKYNPLIWQYSSAGKVNGIAGNVDLDIYYGETVEENTILEKMDIKKGDMNQFSQIVCNIKTALNEDYGLKFAINNSVDEILLANLGNVNMNILTYTCNVTYALTQLLSWWGYAIEPTGEYSNSVSAIISLFQYQAGIEQTGTTTKETWCKLLGK